MRFFKRLQISTDEANIQNNVFYYAVAFVAVAHFSGLFFCPADLFNHCYKQKFYHRTSQIRNNA